MSSGLLPRQPASSSSTSLELREKQAKVARRVQLKGYQEREAMLGDPTKPRTSKVTIEAQCVLKDAAHNLDIDQSKSTYYISAQPGNHFISRALFSTCFVNV